MDSTVMDKEVKEQIKHNAKNLNDIDSSSEVE